MRVKKLNANRRPKAGEDDAVTATDSPNSPTSHWTSPSKDAAGYSSPDSDASSYRRAEVIDLVAESPTDPTATPAPVSAHDVSDLDLHQPHPHENRYITSASSNIMTNVTRNSQSSNSDASSPSWRDRVDRTLRECIHEKIVEYLKALKPNAPAKVLDKLPGLAYTMEEALLKVAASEAEYSDASTLPQRLTLIQQANAKRLLQQQCPAVSPRDKNANGRPGKPLNEEQARVVFSCLQSWRQKLVHMYGSTPTDILTNQILAKVAVFIPSTVQELVICGVSNEQLDRFGNSLLQEIEKVMNALNANANAAAAQQLHQAMQNAPPRSSSPSVVGKRPSPSGGKATNGQAASKASAAAANKKRKTGAEPTPVSSTVRLAAAPSSYISANSFLTPTSTLIRPMDPAFLAAASAAMSAASLPALLPSGPLPTPSAVASATNGKPFFPRIPAPGSNLEQDNRMHLLAQGVGQLSKQQEQADQAKSVEAYEKEIQTLRWLLQESQRDKALLEAEVQRLRQQGA